MAQAPARGPELSFEEHETADFVEQTLGSFGQLKLERPERITGYVTGGISPLGQRRALPTVLDGSALAFETVFVSAGRRGLELELAPTSLVALTGAETRSIAARQW